MSSHEDSLITKQGLSAFREAETIRTLYSQGKAAVVGGLMTAVALLLLLFSHVPSLPLFSWFAVIVAIAGGRFALLQSFHVVKPCLPEDDRWKWWYLAGVGASGLSWGLGGMLLLPLADVSHQFMGLWMIGGLVAGALTILGVWLPAYLLFAFGAILPNTAWFLSYGQADYNIMAALTVFYLLMMLSIAQPIRRRFLRSVDLDYQNHDLVANLREEKRTAEKNAQELHRQILETGKATERLRNSENRFRSMADNMDALIFVYRDTCLYANQAALECSGHRLAALRRVPLWSLLHEDDQLRFRTMASSGRGNRDDVRMVCKNGEIRWLHISTDHTDYDGSPAMIMTAIDITQRKVAESALEEEKERVQVTLASIGDGVITTDTNGRINYLNPVAESLLGCGFRDVFGRRLGDMLHLSDIDGRDMTADPLQLCMQGDQAMNLSNRSLTLKRSDDTEYEVQISASPIRNRSDQVMGCVLVLRDVTELHNLTRKMSYQATHDSLTGLINRAEFERRLNLALDDVGDNGGSHIMLYLDLDQFMVVNDTCGHSAGDEMLRQLTARLQSQIRNGDTLARLGGDEFGVLLKDCSVARAQAFAEEIRCLIRLFRFTWEDKVFEIGVSIGLVAIDADSGLVADVLRAADSACYIAKDQGRNRVHIYQPDDLALVDHQGQMIWMQRLKKALNEDRFSLFIQEIQPLYGDDSGYAHGEILCRMISEEGNLISPLDYLPAAERYHLMPQVDRWVLNHALRWMHEAGNRPGVPKVCGINLSGQSIGDSGFQDYVVQTLEHAGVAPERICFEITETAVIGNLQSATAFIQRLRSMGCRFALDDFGSGLSSFGYLKHLPVDYLKIDGCFVRDMVHDGRDYALVESIHRLGTVLGMQTIAEYALDDDTLKALKDMGVHYAQGYAIGRPRPLDEIYPHSIQRRIA